MARSVREIIKIDEELCDGCGLCVPACHEGALQIIDGKARMVSEKYCDGLGDCIGDCPQGAISFVTREADDFDEEAAREHIEKTQRHAGHDHDAWSCPSARTIDHTKAGGPREHAAVRESVTTELRQWPVKLYLVNPSAPYFQEAHLLIAADCVPFAYGGFHPDFLRDKVLVTGCPKFDETELYARKLAEILRSNSIQSVTVVKMEVPCCSGIAAIAEAAMEASGKNVPYKDITISLTGQVKSQE
ncbi:MAG: hypothetical protein A2Z18_07580 [Armatimonadetes bacterium RBG_16_58_9]|nr:MAG: hypothetical protein A2Z18_07580 [Armatimonadetes bacterium RBG_16_58_9]